ncbi:MAG: hypothetical protein LKF69_01565 [Bacilli bacterium]|jgi:hypothetical protein|nr:hypothetical protein [Bacilli bacterium]MCH4235475.1 hypothetical protein [Bacilli bacterium]
MYSYLKRNKVIFVLLSFVFLFTLFGRNPVFKEYVGKYADLYTVAVHSIEESRGFIDATGTFQPALEKLDEDEQGRVLFCYSEAQETGNVYLLIMQKSDDNDVYYYDKINYICEPLSEGNYVILYGAKKPSIIYDKYNGFSEDMINELKTLNDWNEEINISKCISKVIVRSKPKVNN